MLVNLWTCGIFHTLNLCVLNFRLNLDCLKLYQGHLDKEMCQIAHHQAFDVHVRGPKHHRQIRNPGKKH
jgi:hypothetical protein